ncbi:MAG TPA: Asp-tRNA(Asn)/Glu-tRNA(Gln) amidotransferase subunit GatC [Candidatus Yaniella excrementavium]|nr:Asp-tRNA(Asn)/Glu-tRNA(Gln) amidotransferase subunit GatC [Candidatus Yaniella excrementavium]
MVDNIAATAHIALTEDERQRLAAEFDPIIDSLAVTADEQLPVTVNPLPVNNKVRADVVANELSNEQALSAAPESQDGQFMVPAILDGE